MKLFDPVRGIIRKKHDSIRTEQAYVDWMKRYMKRHQKDMGAKKASVGASGFFVRQTPATVRFSVLQKKGGGADRNTFNHVLGCLNKVILDIVFSVR